MPRYCFQIIGVLIISAAVGLCARGVNYCIAYMFPSEECNQASLPENRLCIETALSQWKERIIWIDARGADDYEKGTVNQPNVYPIRNDSQGQELLSQALPALYQAEAQDQCIIVFCNVDCSASEEVVAILKRYNLKAPIFILEKGWQAIQQHPELTRSQS